MSKSGGLTRSGFRNLSNQRSYLSGSIRVMPIAYAMMLAAPLPRPGPTGTPCSLDQFMKSQTTSKTVCAGFTCHLSFPRVLCCGKVSATTKTSCADLVCHLSFPKSIVPRRKLRRRSNRMCRLHLPPCLSHDSSLRRCSPGRQAAAQPPVPPAAILFLSRFTCVPAPLSGSKLHPALAHGLVEVLVDLLGELQRRVVAQLFVAVVHGRHLNNNGQVAPGPHRHHQ